MLKKKLVKDENKKTKVVKILKPSVATGLGIIAAAAALTTASIGGKTSAKSEIQDIKNNFINTNIEYREYIAKKNAEVDYNYNNGSGEMTFQEWMKKKSEVNSMLDVDDAIAMFADDNVKNEYDKMKDVSYVSNVGIGVGSAVTGLATFLTSMEIFDSGFTKQITKTKTKENDEQEMTK